MESITEISKKYHEVSKEIDYVKRAIPKNPDNREIGENYLERLEKKSEALWEQIQAFRRSAHNRVGYTVRSDIRDSAKAADELEKRASLYRFCVRSAEQAEKAGDRPKADSLRAKAREYVAEMSRIRRSSRRTIATQTGLQIKGASRMVAPVAPSRQDSQKWKERQQRRLDDIEKRLKRIGERCDRLEHTSDDSLRIKRPAGPVKR